MSRHVLILEDSKTQATIISKMFQRAGLEPTWAPTAEEALAHLRGGSFDLLVLDVFVERENTLDQLSTFKTLAGDAHVAIMTAGKLSNPDAAADALNKARRARVDYLLPKPFYFDDVVQICEEVTRKTKARQAAAA